jgi:RNA polymerase sigma factor (sigma-70 family)
MTGPPTTDAELLEGSRTAAEPFRELYERHAGRIHGFHLARCRNADAAHDLTAETFAQAWVSRRRFRDESGGTALPWLFAIARNVLATSVRKSTLERRACDQLGVLDRLDGPHADAEPDESWLDGSLDAALDGLPPAERNAVRLHVLDDLPYDDVAHELATTPGAARVRVHRGLTRLRRLLAEEGEPS